MPKSRTAAEWLEIAEYARAIARDMRDSVSKRLMIGIAEDYEALAGHAGFLAAAKRSLAPSWDHC
jgi:hypothetical protein